MADLHAALADLAAHLDPPPAEGLASRVRAELDRQPRQRRRRLTWRTWLAGIVAFLTPTVLLSDAIADRLGVGGVEVRQAPLPEVVGDELDLGRLVPLPTAAAAAGFPLLIPDDLGQPAEVWLDEREGGPAVTFVWDPRTLLTQLPGRVGLIGKVVGEANVEEVALGDAALWISGPPHVVYHLDESGAVHQDRSRLAANVLLWSKGAVTYRLETDRSRDDALRLARNLVPARGVGGS